MSPGDTRATLAHGYNPHGNPWGGDAREESAMTRHAGRERPIDPHDCATAWFAVLERARLDEDYGLAERATRELERLGVKVRFRRHPKIAMTAVEGGDDGDT